MISDRLIRIVTGGRCGVLREEAAGALSDPDPAPAGLYFREDGRQGSRIGENIGFQFAQLTIEDPLFDAYAQTGVLRAGTVPVNIGNQLGASDQSFFRTHSAYTSGSAELV